MTPISPTTTPILPNPVSDSLRTPSLSERAATLLRSILPSVIKEPAPSIEASSEEWESIEFDLPKLTKECVERIQDICKKPELPEKKDLEMCIEKEINAYLEDPSTRGLNLDEITTLVVDRLCLGIECISYLESAFSPAMQESLQLSKKPDFLLWLYQELRSYFIEVKTLEGSIPRNVAENIAKRFFDAKFLTVFQPILLDYLENFDFLLNEEGVLSEIHAYLQEVFSDVVLEGGFPILNEEALQHMLQNLKARPAFSRYSVTPLAEASIPILSGISSATDALIHLLATPCLLEVARKIAAKRLQHFKSKIEKAHLSDAEEILLSSVEQQTAHLLDQCAAMTIDPLSLESGEAFLLAYGDRSHETLEALKAFVEPKDLDLEHQPLKSLIRTRYEVAPGCERDLSKTKPLPALETLSVEIGSGKTIFTKEHISSSILPFNLTQYAKNSKGAIPFAVLWKKVFAAPATDMCVFGKVPNPASGRILNYNITSIAPLFASPLPPILILDFGNNRETLLCDAPVSFSLPAHRCTGGGCSYVLNSFTAYTNHKDHSTVIFTRSQISNVWTGHSKEVLLNIREEEAILRILSRYPISLMVYQKEGVREIATAALEPRQFATFSPLAKKEGSTKPQDWEELGNS